MKSGRYLKSVRDALPESAQTNLDRAFVGDALAARRLMITAPKRLRGHIAFLAYQAKIPNPAYREIIKAVWTTKDARHLLTGFWRPQLVRRMLERADFTVPELAGPVTIYRPLCGTHLKKAAAELIWSLSPERVAEAARTADGTPKLLRATIDPTDIIYFGNRHGEQEVVSRHAVEDAVLIEPLHLMPRAALKKPPAPVHRRAGSHQR